jgi:hypothetical protein
MNLTFDSAATKMLSDGIILLDQTGQPREANAAAQPWLRRCIEFTPHWAKQVALERAGTLKLPATLDLDSGGDGSLSARVLLLKNRNAGYALLIQPLQTAPPPAHKSGQSGFLALISSKARKEVSQFSTRLREFDNSEAQRSELMHQAAALDTLLTELAAMAELDQRDEVFAEERLSIAEVLQSTLTSLPQTMGANPIRYVLTEIGQEMAPVYGHRKWLSQTLYSLLARLGRSCQEHGRVAINLRQIGDFVVLNGRTTSDTPGAFAASAMPAGPPGDELSADICHRIIELHGGQLKVRFINSDPDQQGHDAEGEIESIMLSLPTGVPEGDRSRISCAECRITLQSMQYARDLAEMMAGGVPVSNPATENQDPGSTRR